MDTIEIREICGNRILIEKVEITKGSNIIEVPKSFDEPLIGRVLKKGKNLTENIKESDLVLYDENIAIPIKINSKQYFILREYDVIGLL